jgi:PPOX class probable F420-dependent enzyme
VPASLSDADLVLLGETNYAVLATLNPDGSLQATVTWVDAADGLVRINTAEGRRKERNMRRDPRVAVTVIRHGDEYRWITVEGRVVERVTGPEADEHIDALSRKYDGEPWAPVAGQVRVLYRIRPERIIRYGS